MDSSGDVSGDRGRDDRVLCRGPRSWSKAELAEEVQGEVDVKLEEQEHEV